MDSRASSCDIEGASYYDALNLDRRASSAEVESAFLKVDEAFRDIGAGWEGQAAADTDLIREAYNVRIPIFAPSYVFDVSIVCLICIWCAANPSGTVAHTTRWSAFRFSVTRHKGMCTTYTASKV